MKVGDRVSDEKFLEEIGRRLADLRLAQNMTQSDLAREAGVGLRTLQRMESGEVGSRLSGFVGVCRVLGIRDRFFLLLPERTISPMDQLKLEGKKRERATGSRGNDGVTLRDEPNPWKWGDEK